MKFNRALFGLLFVVAIACSGAFRTKAIAQVTITPTSVPTSVTTMEPTTAPTVVPTTYPTYHPVTYATSAPAYYVSGPPTLILGTPPPTTIALKHIWNFNYYGSLTQSQNCKTIAPYVDIVYPKGSALQAWHACGVKVFSYASPAMPQNGEYELAQTYGGLSMTATPSPSPGPYYNVLAKTTTGALIVSYNGTGVEFDPHASNASAYLTDSMNHAVTQAATWNSGDTPDFLFHDNSDEIYGLSGTPADWIGQNDWATHTKFDYDGANNQGKTLILNALALVTAYSVPPSDDTIANVIIPLESPTVAGAMYEGWAWNNQNQSGYNTLTGSGSAWQSEEDTQIAVVKMGKIFNALANGPFTTYENTNGADSINGINARLFVYASLLLTYSPTLTLWGEEVTNTPSGWMQFPEEGFVVYNPHTVPNRIADLLSGSIYEQRYQLCYYQGQLIGSCMIAVNPTTASASVPNAGSYTASMALSGSDIIDGGTASFNGAVSTTLAPKAAEILVIPTILPQ